MKIQRSVYRIAISVLFTLTVVVLAGTGERFANAHDSAATSLESRLKNLEDREAIRELLIEYGRDLDKEDLRAYSSLFAKDGVWEGGIGKATGPDGIYEMLKKVLSKVPPGKYGNSFHIMSSMDIQVHGDTAEAWSRWTWFVQGADGKPVAQRSGHYEDTLAREQGQWKFKYRLTVTELPTAKEDSESSVWRTDYRK